MPLWSGRLGHRPDHELADVDIRRLLDRIRDGTGNRIRGEDDLAELRHELRGLDRSDRIGQFGDDRTWRDKRHANILRFEPQPLGDGAHSKFGSRIDRAGRPNAMRSGRRDIDDVTSLALIEVRKDGCNPVQDTTDVHVDHPVPFIHFQLGERRKRHDASVVHDDIDLTECTNGEVGKGIHFVEPGHIERLELGDPAISANLRDELFETIGAARAEYDARTPGGKVAGHGFANSTAGTGNEDDFLSDEIIHGMEEAGRGSFPRSRLAHPINPQRLPQYPGIRNSCLILLLNKRLFAIAPKVIAYNTKMVASRTNTSVNAQMVAALSSLARGQGFSPSLLSGVKFMRSTTHIPASPITYEPSIVIIAQGRKLGRLGEKTFVYDRDNYLVLTVPLPFECETFGTASRPLLGLSIGVTPALIAELVMQIERSPENSDEPPQAVEAAPLDEALGGAAVRLLESLHSPEEARILGPQIVREIAYRALLGPLGANLRALAAPQSHFGRIGRVLNRLHTDFAGNHDLETLAREAGMSVSTFHAHFKRVTASSPLQYLKTIRLHKARMLMVHDGLGAAGAALQVGYESASQFNREFKRHFGGPPAEVAARLRASLTRFA